MELREVLSALADENRQRVLEALGKGRRSTTELAAAVGVSPTGLTYHLRRLREAGLIRETRWRHYIFWELEPEGLDGAIRWLRALRGE